MPQYYSLDDVSVRDSLIADPVGFIDSHASQTLIIDEVQLLPELLRTVKLALIKIVDQGVFFSPVPPIY